MQPSSAHAVSMSAGDLFQDGGLESDIEDDYADRCDL